MYPAYLLCLLLTIPAFAVTAFITVILLLAAGPKDGWSVLLNAISFFGAGLVEPLRYGWRPALLLIAIVFMLGAGAIPVVRGYAFYGLATVVSLCVAFCFYIALKQDVYNVIDASLVLSPSLIGIAVCFWFAAKFKT